MLICFAVYACASKETAPIINTASLGGSCEDLIFAADQECKLNRNDACQTSAQKAREICDQLTDEQISYRSFDQCYQSPKEALEMPPLKDICSATLRVFPDWDRAKNL